MPGVGEGLVAFLMGPWGAQTKLKGRWAVQGWLHGPLAQAPPTPASLEILNNCIFELVCCKWSLVGYWSVHQGFVPGARRLASHGPPGCPRPCWLGPGTPSEPHTHTSPATAATFCPQWGPRRIRDSHTHPMVASWGGAWRWLLLPWAGSHTA